LADHSDSALARKWSDRFRAPLLGVAGDENSMGMLRLASTIGLVFLLLYFIADLSIRNPESIELHVLLIAGTVAFTLLTWTPIFQRFFRWWVFALCTFIMAMFIVISAVTHDPVSRLIATLLCPLATASFVSWSPRWQLGLSFVALIAYAIAQVFIPIHDGFDTYRWFSLLAALALGEASAIFVDQYRREIRTQMEALQSAAQFRERQIATMAHDIRNPVSALAGYVELLEETSMTPQDRERMIARIGSTAWNTNLVVSNVLDLYRIEENGRVLPAPTSDADPNGIIAEVAEDCAAQARRADVDLRRELSHLPKVRLDLRHLERILRNLAAVPIAYGIGTHVVMRSSAREGRIAIELDAPGAKISARELEQLTTNPRTAERPPGAGKVGLYLARAMTEAAGGSLLVKTSEPTGIYIRAEFPSATTGTA
jgi:signal transduction histidine kinase